MFYLSSTLIEAKPQSNCMIQGDFGDSIDNFEEERLLSEFNKLDFHDWNGSLGLHALSVNGYGIK